MVGEKPSTSFAFGSRMDSVIYASSAVTTVPSVKVTRFTIQTKPGGTGQRSAINRVTAHTTILHSKQLTHVLREFGWRRRSPAVLQSMHHRSACSIHDNRVFHICMRSTTQLCTTDLVITDQRRGDSVFGHAPRHNILFDAEFRHPKGMDHIR